MDALLAHLARGLEHLLHELAGLVLRGVGRQLELRERGEVGVVLLSHSRGHRRR